MSVYLRLNLVEGEFVSVDRTTWLTGTAPVKRRDCSGLRAGLTCTQTPSHHDHWNIPLTAGHTHTHTHTDRNAYIYFAWNTNDRASSSVSPPCDSWVMFRADFLILNCESLVKPLTLIGVDKGSPRVTTDHTEQVSGSSWASDERGETDRFKAQEAAAASCILLASFFFHFPSPN